MVCYQKLMIHYQNKLRVCCFQWCGHSRAE